MVCLQDVRSDAVAAQVSRLILGAFRSLFQMSLEQSCGLAVGCFLAHESLLQCGVHVVDSGTFQDTILSFSGS